MILYAGTSGFSYKEWKGRFYPPDMSAAGMLEFYGTQFQSVEINSTFFRLPAATVIKNWCAQVPVNFKFAFKAPRLITHSLQLQDADEAVGKFTAATDGSGKRLGPLLFQLPPFFKKDTDRLRTFLALRPATSRWAFEFRHASWFDDEVFDLLKEQQCALCINDGEMDFEIPLVATADWGYLRLRRADYSEKDVKTWAKRVRQQKWKDAFVYFKHEDEAKGPTAARQFLDAF